MAHPTTSTRLPAPIQPYVIPAPGAERLYLPRRSRQVPTKAWATYAGPIHAHWQTLAAAKGFRVARRVRNKDHVALACHLCGELTAQKLHTLRTANPECGACQHAALKATARAAGLVFLGYHPDDRHLGLYRAPCGHSIQRQFEFVARIAEGRCKHRCETCHYDKELSEAEARGWTRIGADPRCDPNYRLYRHSCGHEQRVARSNMQSGRFNCEACGEGWSSAPSFIYAMRFDLPDGLRVVKLGFSRDPDSRLNHQLKRQPDLPAQLLRAVPMHSGRAALCREKSLHGALKSAHPDAVIAPERFRNWLTVVSEIYAAKLETEILAELDAMVDRRAT